MKNEQYSQIREKWRAMIRTRDDRSEIVNYDDPSFPSYSFEGHMDGSSPWIRKAHWHDDVEMMTVLTEMWFFFFQLHDRTVCQMLQNHTARFSKK